MIVALAQDISHPDDEDDMHVMIVGETEENIEKAEELVKDILFNPEKAMALKHTQLRQVTALRFTLGCLLCVLLGVFCLPSGP